MIKPRTRYLIKGSSPYFLNKYGTSTPTIAIEDKASIDWRTSMYPGPILFRLRSISEKLPVNTDTIYYGHINGLGELVCESELEEFVVTPQNILGSVVLCPHCNKMLKVVKAEETIFEGIDPAGRPNTWFVITFTDGASARMWQHEYP